MKKIYSVLLTIGAFLALSSCSSSFSVQGSSNISTLDGRMLYLKVLKNNEFKNVDSCDVVHGQFQFKGSIDSTRMANIFMEDEQLMPIVLEGGDIVVKVDDTEMTASGTPLNEKLYGFLKEYNKVIGEQADLVHQHDKDIMDGEDMNEVIPLLQDKELMLTAKQDSLVTHFVTDNYDNVLGPGVFFLVTISYQYPELTPWIEDIMSKATDFFKNDAYVKDFYQKAQQNQQIMNGLIDNPAQQAAPVYDVAPQNITAAPTPNELAKPQNSEPAQKTE